MGTVLAELLWTPSSAQMQQGEAIQSYANLALMSIQLTGTDLPIAALFEWLNGRDPHPDEWTADLTQLGEGRLTVRRHAPDTELRLILDPRP